MGHPATMARGTSCADATRARNLAPTDGLPAPQFLQNFAAPEGRRCQLSARRAWRPDERGGRWLRNMGRCVLTAPRKKTDRLCQRPFLLVH